MTGRCIHCLAPVTPPAEVCKSCVDLLDDLGEYDDDYEPPPSPVPPPQPRPRTGRYEPTPQEIAEYEELSARGSFRPFDDVRAKEPPGHARGKWGRAMASFKKDQPPK